MKAKSEFFGLFGRYAMKVIHYLKFLQLIAFI